MMTCKCTISPNLLRITRMDWTIVLSNALDLITLAVLEVIKSPGFCPVDTGDLRDGHFPELTSPLIKSIKCSVRYWIYVVYGHKVAKIKNERQLKAFFAKLNSGEIPKPKGVTFVKGDNYVYRAVIQVHKSGVVQKIIQSEMKIALGGGYKVAR